MDVDLDRHLFTAIGLMDDGQTREARRLTGQPDDEGRFLQLSGIPTSLPWPVLAEEPEEVRPMTPAEQIRVQADEGIPFREASYTTRQNGEPVTVNYTGDPTEIRQRAADLVAVVRGAYGGTPNLESGKALDILQTVEHGGALDAAEWQALEQLEAKYAKQLSAFRMRGRDGQDPIGSEPPTRVSTKESAQRELREAKVPTTEPDTPEQAALRALDDAVPLDDPSRHHVDRLKAKPPSDWTQPDRNALHVLCDTHIGNGYVEPMEEEDDDSGTAVDKSAQPGLADADSAESILTGAGHSLEEADGDQPLHDLRIPMKPMRT